MDWSWLLGSYHDQIVAMGKQPVSLVTVNLALTVVTALKGKFWLALLSTFLAVAGLIGSIRLARPESPWARRRYSPGRQALAVRRALPWTRRRQRLLSLIGGSPTAAGP